MPADERPAVLSPLRQRRRAAATQEILDAAERHISEHGPAALSLRAVARSLGMTVQALYHYFPKRDDLVTALIAKTYDELAGAVQAAVDAPPDDPDLPGLVVATEGYRRWAVEHPERFQLLYGAPLRYYAAPSDGPTTHAVRRMGAIFEREMFGGFSPEQLAAAELPPLSPELRAYLEELQPTGRQEGLPPAALVLLTSAWGHMHGLVTLETFGHLAHLGSQSAEMFRISMRNMLEDIHRRIPAR
ncbi:TetR/AcrR family transcriptional regulator [Streptomyces boncukensis]|uniref:TetR/AcrR family transcriptional regulator n=1 Tax=Streptomyces boncukensis TaxID=2711219 RepID=A0A6G4X2E3_9ACTN|nr:TetR/AcrR family transcriptional regulator [Streptomyces boncukensis]NGO70831.1 TetR/AcrR family transcriptional regulator [Streptomyces boncukensis]